MCKNVFMCWKFGNNKPLEIMDLKIAAEPRILRFAPIQQILIICVLLIIVLVPGTHQLQRFSEQPRYTEVNPGQDALLTCKVVEKRGSCSWQKDNKPIGMYPKKYEWAMGSIIHQAIHGDCSLWIRAATLEFDDGLWECQVTASDFTTQDALTSQPVRLVVRVPPQRPRLEYETVTVLPGHNITVNSGSPAVVKCVSQYGNPPALIKWFLEEQEIAPMHTQTNSTEPDSPRTWSATSVVQVPTNKERHRNSLRCVALHESYSSKSAAVEAKLDVRYAPTIRLSGAPAIDLEEGKDFLILRCEADANPRASIVWRRAGRSDIVTVQETLQLRPVGRRDAGLYTCQAQNLVGSSETLSVQVDVKYPPRILSVGPDKLSTSILYSTVTLECLAEGNPPPTFRWVQKNTRINSDQIERGREGRLIITNVTYDYQGEYECHAINFINGQERIVVSEAVTLEVVGAPQVLRFTPETAAKRGDSVALSQVVCADPRPRHVSWEWGSLRLEAGDRFGRYQADEIVQDQRDDCYLASLHIMDVNSQDSRAYYLVVENDRGTDKHPVHLNVDDPVEVGYIFGIIGGCVAAILILICLLIYVLRKNNCCFKKTTSIKMTEIEQKTIGTNFDGPTMDSVYTTSAVYKNYSSSQHPSPEAMKIPIESPMDNQMVNADLVMGSQNQHRDLFTGSVGLPNTNTHVGSVVHAFETMAMKRQVVDPKPQLRNQGAPLKLASTTLPAQKKEKKFLKNTTKRMAPGSTLHKITLTEQNPETSMTHLSNSAGSPKMVDEDQRSEYETNFMGDYRKNLFYDSTLDKRELLDNQSQHDEDQLIRGTMVSRSFIKNVRKTRRIADENPTRMSPQYNRGQMIPTRDQDTYPLQSNRNTLFRPKPADRAIL